MSYVAADASIRAFSVSPAAVAAKFGGTPLQGYEGVFWELAARHGIDPNWALSYLQWESGFGGSAIGRGNPTNPWDILCYDGQWGQVGENRPGNGYCYAEFASVETGLEAGFRLWDRYVQRGWSDWRASLCVAVSGPNGPCNEGWVNNVIAQGQRNAALWPYDGSSPPPATGRSGGGGEPAIDLSWLPSNSWMPLLALGVGLVLASVGRR